jgi:hypothetical protein
MKTNSLTGFILMFVVLAPGCGENTRTARCEPPPSTACTCVDAPTPPPAHACVNGKDGKRQRGFFGDVYLWHKSAPCVRKIRSPEDGPYKCLEIPPWVVGGVVAARTACYARGNINQVIEIVRTGSPIGENTSLENSGWRECTRPEKEITLMPECLWHPW